MRTGADSRLAGFNREVTHTVLPYERTYCANCGKPWGWTTQDSSQYIAAAEIVVVCDECFESLNAKEQSRRIPEAKAAKLGLVTELKPRNFMETAAHFRRVTTPVEWPSDDPDIKKTE